ncbi:MAG: hypothetical protein ACI9WS_003126 [Paraglaciecola psychrophila]|jgi:hypothetical protein
MFTAIATYRRTLITSLVIALVLVFSFTSLRLSAWQGLLPFFGWMETTIFGVIGKTYGAAFAVIEAIHLLAMALLGGAVMISDGRLVGLLLTDVPARTVIDKSHKLFVVALLVVVFTGVFMACGVAMKVYYLDVFFYKMLVLSAGVLFVFFIRRPLLQQDLDTISPTVKKCVALSSLLIWFTVAAAGRWIGFS